MLFIAKSHGRDNRRSYLDGHGVRGISHDHHNPSIELQHGLTTIIKDRVPRSQLEHHRMIREEGFFGRLSARVSNKIREGVSEHQIRAFSGCRSTPCQGLKTLASARWKHDMHTIFLSSHLHAVGGGRGHTILSCRDLASADNVCKNLAAIFGKVGPTDIQIHLESMLLFAPTGGGSQALRVERFDILSHEQSCFDIICQCNYSYYSPWKRHGELEDVPKGWEVQWDLSLLF